jgi:hypothetical protein
MKRTVTLLIVLLLALTGCGKSSQLLDSLNELQSGLSDAEEELGELTGEDSEGEEESNESPEEEGQGWPDAMPSDIPEIKGVRVDGFARDNNDFLVNFYVEESQKQILLDYIDALEADGYTRDSMTENKFGFNYFGYNDKYTVTFNVIFGSLSKLDVMIR